MATESHEFYSPFAHIPDRYEWCRIHSSTHGSFDTFILIHRSTADPVTVYVHEPEAERFMADRFPESECIVVAPDRLSIDADSRGRRVTGILRSNRGPVREARMVFEADPRALPVTVAYGGSGFRVWGSRFRCAGVDLNLGAGVSGYLVDADGVREEVSGARAIIAVGSYGKLEPFEEGR